ncbi:MAG TPA: GIY-YIG nuclease family protein [Ramlibacter sp.]|nr:GIY-YIG nuclease family protein [Ramlibacter sp.]
MASDKKPRERKKGGKAAVPPASNWAEAWAQVVADLDKQDPQPDVKAEGYATFKLGLEQAMSRQLTPFFQCLSPASLTPEVLATIPPGARGAYYLLLRDQVVYIGKSDAKTGLQTRLLRHYRTLRRRQNIAWQEMKFKAVEIPSFSALDSESILLDIHKLMNKAAGGSGKASEWNNSGFGSNDTGAERDTQKVSLFDRQFPLDLDGTIDVEPELPVPSGTIPLNEYLMWLRDTVQLTFRFSKKVPKGSELSSVSVDAAHMTTSMRFGDLLQRVHENLPADWTLVVLRGKLLLCYGPLAKYKSPLWMLRAGTTAGQPNYDMAAAAQEDDALAAGEAEAEIESSPADDSQVEDPPTP